jgi:hypothetical protein
MKPDLGLESTRKIREKISREFGNDSSRLVEYYLEFQKRFKDRLRPSPSSDKTRCSSPRKGE